ncbi:MAG: hypothetical protein M9953_12090 [Thermomicrobiales bacterium]|nr:hypothetical protein [Thermomicrobiales bacterium]
MVFFSLVELERAVDASIGDYVWPPNVLISAKALVAPFYNSPSANLSRFEVPYQHIILTGVNICAWYETWLHARANGDDTLLQMAIKVMTDEIPYYPTREADRALLERYAQSASLGDPALVQNYYGLNCEAIEFLWKP